MNQHVNRAAFLRNGAKGGLLLVAGSTIVAQAEGIALGQTNQDADIAKLAATAELLAADFYTRAIRARRGGRPVFRGNASKYLKAARKNEIEHYEALAALLGDSAPKDLSFKYPAGTFKSATSVFKLGSVLETAFIGAYLGQLNNLSTPELRLIAAQIAVNEGAHLGFFNSSLGKAVATLPKTITAQQAADAVGGFVAG